MGKKKAATGPESDPKPAAKRYGTLIRVSDAFAEAMREGASISRKSMAEFADEEILAFVKQRSLALLDKKRDQLREKK